jgi:hypothetical protein
MIMIVIICMVAIWDLTGAFGEDKRQRWPVRTE